MDEELRILVERANSGQHIEQHALAVRLRDGKGFEKSIDDAKTWFKKASESGISWMINDYVECLIAGSEQELIEAKELLKKPMLEGNNQSIRWYAHILLKSEEIESQILGKNLLIESHYLGNKWAIMDLIKICKKSGSTTELFNFCCNMPNPPDVLVLSVFEIYTKRTPLEIVKMKKLMDLELSNDQVYSKMVDILMLDPKKGYDRLIDIKKMNSSNDFKLKLAKMYRDGKILEKSSVKYINTIKGIPSNILENL